MRIFASIGVRYGACAAMAAAFAATVPAEAATQLRVAAPAVTITEFADLPPTQAFGFPTALTAGPDRSLWVSEVEDQDFGTPSIDRIALDGKRTATYFFNENSSPAAGDIVAGPDGNVWFIDFDSGSIVRVTPSGHFTAFPADAPGAGLAVGPDRALWFPIISFTGNFIGRLTTGGSLTMYDQGLSPNAAPSDIAAGPDGAMWFTDPKLGRIGRIDVTSHAITEFSKGISTGSQPESIALGADGALWFTEARAGSIGRITTGGTVSEFPIPTGGHPNDLALGPDGAIWFTLDHPAAIGRITARGRISEFNHGLSQGSGPGCIAAGPDGNMWFAERSGNRIARVNLH